jgi:hypothetical protein
MNPVRWRLKIVIGMLVYSSCERILVNGAGR